MLPFWADVGVDGADGGFVERLTLPGAPADDDYKRIVVQARQIYAFSHAHVLGAGDYALAAAQNGYRFMTGHGWDADHGGWCFSVRRDGASLDRRKDRKSGGEGKSVSVRVDLGGSGIIQKKN